MLNRQTRILIDASQKARREKLAFDETKSCGKELKGSSGQVEAYTITQQPGELS